MIEATPVQAAQVIAVAPTPTLIMPATATTHIDTLAITRTNQDISQVLNEQIEAANSAAGPWSVQTNADLQSIQPGETRVRTVSVRGFPFIRTTGTASGAGLNVLASTSVIREASS